MLRSARNYDRDSASLAAGVASELDLYPSRTVQSEKDNSDINVILKRFGVTGHLPQAARLPQYGDYTGIDDFHTAMNVVREAQEGFNALPSGLRRRFGNDPQAYLEFVSNPENEEELVKLGIAVPRETSIMDSKVENRSPPDTKEKDDVKRRRPKDRAASAAEGSKESGRSRTADESGAG